MSKDIDLKNYIRFDSIPGMIKAVEVYFDVLKDLYKKDEIGITMFFILLSAYVDEWKGKVIKNEADKVEKVFNQKLKKG